MSSGLSILAIEPWDAGSHRAFLDGWSSRSRHAIDVVGLPGRHWKWRMRHGAATAARLVDERLASGARYDAMWVSDMLDLASFRGLSARAVRDLPAVAYFHENQLTYPVRHADERDLHLAYTNITTCLAADAVWFNSGFHMDAFAKAARALLRRMPDYGEVEAFEAAMGRARVMSPGVDVPEGAVGAREAGPLRIGWAARWEHDKRPELFFAAVDRLAALGVDFRLIVLGESFAERPAVFDAARTRHADRIDVWGGVDSRDAYLAALSRCDVLVSTAAHEFYGLSVLEGAVRGALPLVPDALAYPETLTGLDAWHFHDGDADVIARRLASAPRETRAAVASLVRARHDAGVRARAMDDALAAMCAGGARDA